MESPKRSATESAKHWDPSSSSSGNRTFTKKTNIVSKIASAFAEPNTFKIITWADKSQSPKRNDEEFLYQNVSNSGTNYLEYKLKNMISKTEEQDENFGKAKMTNKALTTSSELEKTASPTWIPAPTRQIQVHQIKNKTVVKISVNDCPKSENYFKPLREDEDENELSDYQYPGILFDQKQQQETAAPTNEYAEPYHGELYANIDLSKKRKNQIYENSEPADQVYMNIADSNEPHYLNATVSDDTDQVYENEDFTVLRNSQVTQSIIQKNALPTREDVYENTEFLGNVLESIQFTGPGIVSDSGNYQTPRPVRVVVDPEMLKTEDYTLDSDPEAKVIVTINGHKRAESITSSGVGVDSEVSDTEESNISCDSLNSNDLHTSEDHGYHTPTSENKTVSPIDHYQNVKSVDFDGTDIIQQVASAAERIKNLRLENTGMYLARRIESCEDNLYENSPKALPTGLLNDIRARNVKNLSAYPKGEKPDTHHLPKGIIKLFETGEAGNKRVVINERTYEERKTENKICGLELDTDKFYKFHLYENADDGVDEHQMPDDETFAGYRDYLNRERPAAITSSKGTIRGVKNRVKAGIATFLQLQETKAYKDKDAGKVVVYSTTMGIVRETYQKCLKVKQILKTLLVKFEERDVFMSTEAQEEIRERMKCDAILVPQVFVEGQHIGDAETIERLNETGELRKILKPYKRADAGVTCKVCGGYRLLPCRICKGSKKSIHRNHFTAEFVSLKCMNCDPVGLMKCYAC